MDLLKPLIALLAIVNPLGAVPFFIHFTQSFTRDSAGARSASASFSAFVRDRGQRAARA